MLDTLESIICVSNKILTLLDTQDIIAGELTTSDEVFNLSSDRENLLHSFFELNSEEELQECSKYLQEIHRLDLSITAKSNSVYQRAKMEVLKFKKNQKAINAYQKV